MFPGAYFGRRFFPAVYWPGGVAVGAPKFPETGIFERAGFAGQFSRTGMTGAFDRHGFAAILSGIDLRGIFERAGMSGLFERGEE